MGNSPLPLTAPPPVGAGETAAGPLPATESARARERELEVRIAALVRELEALRSSQARLGEERLLLERAAITESIQDGLAMIDPAGQVIYQNRVLRELLGYASLGEASLPPAQMEALWELADLDGRPVPIEAWPRWRALRGETFNGCELRVRRRDGSREFIASYGGSLVRSPAGDPLFALLVVRDITAHKRGEDALREANERLRKADHRKNEFLATLAHELRNPLAPIRTGLDLIQALACDAAVCEQPRQMMDRQLTHLVRLVDDLLDFSRISRGKIALRKERLDLAAIIDVALEMSASALRRSERHLIVSVPPEPLPVEGDRVRLVQIVSNLLNNAAKFTDAGGHIALRVALQGDHVQIQVQDDGPGIPRDRLTDIFEPFVPTEYGRGGGLGVGLTLVRSLAEMHGGTVSAASAGPGRGAVFTVSLPLCRDVPVQPTLGEAMATSPVPGRRVLVVDDNRDIVDGMRLLLQTLKAEVRVAHDGAEAIRICANWQPTHVLMDLGMPIMDGYEAARRLCANHPNRAFRLVAISGWGQDEQRRRAREAGFDQHLTKPVRVADIKAILCA